MNRTVNLQGEGRVRRGVLRLTRDTLGGSMVESVDILRGDGRSARRGEGEVCKREVARVRFTLLDE